MGVIAKTLSEINRSVRKFNPNHGSDGKFTTTIAEGGGGSGPYENTTGQSVSDEQGKFKTTPWKKGNSATQKWATGYGTFTQTSYFDPKSPQHHFVRVVHDHDDGSVEVGHTGGKGGNDRAWGKFGGEGATDRASAYLKDKFNIDHKF